MTDQVEAAMVTDQVQIEELSKLKENEKSQVQLGSDNSNSVEQVVADQTHDLEVTSKTLNVVYICEKLEGAYAMVFVDKIVLVNDPYGFRLLVMGRKNCNVDVEWTVLIMKLIKNGRNKICLDKSRIVKFM